ncbi:MAG: PEP/pyruvate-binding domain-containing protein [Candidatus Zixiibacteriota bacterium]
MEYKEYKKMEKFFSRFEYGEDVFHTLMKKRVREVLLVSSFYDAYIFKKDGRLSEQIFRDYHELNLTSAARITNVPTAKAALEKLKYKKFDLVITMMRIGEITPFDLARRIKEQYENLKVLLLLNMQSDLALVDKSKSAMEHIDNVFLWKGDSKVFLAMIKYVEDQMNAPHDTEVGMVRVILLVEDSILFYSQYLPELYGEIMAQTSQLISEETDAMQKNYQMRTRPKILMAHTYEEAIDIANTYSDNLLCMITDVRFSKDGEINDNAGVELANHIREDLPYLPIVVWSSDEDARYKVENLDVKYLCKNSKHLMDDLSYFIHTDLGFGAFIFRDMHGNEIHRAETMAEFEQALPSISDECLLYHAKQNHFSAWLIAHGEIQISKKVRPLQIADFDSVDDLRQYLIDIFKKVRDKKNRGHIVDFDPRNIDSEYEIIRLFDGSLGGKGRGIAFLNALFASMDFEERYPSVDIKVPRTAFIGTGEFDRFLHKNEINNWILSQEHSDEQIRKRFLKGELSEQLKYRLNVYLQHIKKPLAVRSSGLLEDSQSQPFAGIYQTYMIPNNNEKLAIRQKQLECAIKLVFASTFLGSARDYVERIKYKSREEKMAVILQEIVGDYFDNYYYPHISGVGQSYNFYPTSYLKHSDGIASLALGLGHWVVDGNPSYRYCPKYPKFQILQPKDQLKNSQTHFFALNMDKAICDLFENSYSETTTLEKLTIAKAEKQGSLTHLASVWSQQDERIRDGIDNPGPRIVTFADIIKHEYFPLSGILEELLDLGEKAFGVPVEIEFAVNLNKDPEQGKKPSFYILQIRPLSVHAEEILLDPDELEEEQLFLYTEHGMGNGHIDEIHDIILVAPEKFDKTETLKIKDEIRQLNQKLDEENRDCILIGPGRWGSRDRFLGIPVQWADISRARVIVEAGIKDLVVDSSQGTHFFHNLVAMDAGYISVEYASDKEFIKWDWLLRQNIIEKTDYCLHIRRDEPFEVKMFGRDGIAALFK